MDTSVRDKFIHKVSKVSFTENHDVNVAFSILEPGDNIVTSCDRYKQSSS